jgi:hypothetical protein
MWALVDKNTNQVINCIAGIPYEEASSLAGENILIAMTLENSPAYLEGYWDGTRFLPSHREEHKHLWQNMQLSKTE